MRPRHWSARVKAGLGGGLIGIHSALTDASLLAAVVLIVGVSAIAAAFSELDRR